MMFKYSDQLAKSGLSNPLNWEGDMRPRIVKLVEPLLENSKYYWRMNETDSSSRILEFWKIGDTHRSMGVDGKKNDLNLGSFFNSDFHKEVSRYLAFDNLKTSTKKPRHYRISLEFFWNVICVATNNYDSMI